MENVDDRASSRRFRSCDARQKASTAAKIIGAFPLDSRRSRNKVHFHGITISGNWHLRWWMRAAPIIFQNEHTGRTKRGWEEDEGRGGGMESTGRNRGSTVHGDAEDRRKRVFYTSAAVHPFVFLSDRGGDPRRITKPSHRQLANDSPSCPPCQDSTTRARRAASFQRDSRHVGISFRFVYTRVEL